MSSDNQSKHKDKAGLPTLVKIMIWPFAAIWRSLYEHWLSYVFGRVLKDDRRIYSVRFISYGDSVYLHPMIWGSLILYFLARSNLIGQGWPVLIWYMLLCLCFLTVIYNFDIFKAGILAVSIVAVLGLAYISQAKWEWNPLARVGDYVEGLEITVSRTFYIASAWIFALLISVEVIWAWMFHRVELDESYVYERRFMQSTTREPIFARGLKRETKDLLELLIMGAGDITHRTKNGVKRFKNVPGASLGLGRAIDSMLDYRRPGQVKLEGGKHRDDADQVMPTDAFPDLQDDDGIHDDNGADDGADEGDAF